MSLVDHLVAPGVVVGTVAGVMVAIAIDRIFPDHDLSFVQASVALAGVLIGLTLDLVVKSWDER